MNCMVVIIFAINFCVHNAIEAQEDNVSLVATAQTDDQRNLDTFGGTAHWSTDSVDVSCTTIDDVTAARRSLCPAQCHCSPLSGQEVWTKLIVDCSGAEFNHSTSSQLSQDLTNLLSRCVSELTELMISNTPLTSVPENICRLSKIRSLHLDSNHLSSLPGNCFTRMQNLTSFQANYNRLTSLQVS